MNILSPSRNKIRAALAIIALFGLAAVGNVPSAAAVEEGTNNRPAEQSQNNDQNTYVYTAQPGDSYALIARKAVQTYGILNKVNLSQAQIIAAETQLTEASNFPALAEGQKVELTPSSVKSAVESAQKLTAEQQAAWQPYVAYVDFNTDTVGESGS